MSMKNGKAGDLSVLSISASTAKNVLIMGSKD